MSVLIKGMEMSKCCAECEWHEYYGGDYDWVHACRRTGTMPIENAETERANDCPLIEISTPHGDLVDRDELSAISYYDTGGYFDDGVLWTLEQVDKLKPIIEAEE